MKILQILVLILGLVVFMNAQTVTLEGSVYDAAGSLIPKVVVTARNHKGETFATETNDEGEYSLTLSVNLYDAKTTSVFRAAKYEITFDKENWGFEKLVLKDFKFAPAYSGKMNLDVALDSIDPEPCGYAGSDCLESLVI